MACDPLFSASFFPPRAHYCFSGGKPLEWFPGPCGNSCFFLCYSGLKFCVTWKNMGKKDRQGRAGSLPCVRLMLRGCSPDVSWVSRLWPGARQGAFLRLLLGRLRTCHRFPTSIVPPQAADTHPGLRALDFRESRLCPRGVYILVQEDKQ